MPNARSSQKQRKGARHVTQPDYQTVASLYSHPAFRRLSKDDTYVTLWQRADYVHRSVLPVTGGIELELSSHVPDKRPGPIHACNRIPGRTRRFYIDSWTRVVVEWDG